MRIYNYISSKDNAVTWGYLRNYLRKERYNVAVMKTVYHPETLFIESLKLFFIFHYILHFIPAVLGDLFLRISGRKQM